MGRHNRDAVLSFLMATLAFLADFSILSRFFASLFAKAVLNASDIILLCLKIGTCVARDLVFGI
jgi:hypothetical protein